MSTTISKQTITIAGLNVNVFSYADLSARGKPVAVLFLLHGRKESTKRLDIIAERVLEYVQSQPLSQQARDLVVVSFDHRNHGTRLVDPKLNDDWVANNERHALDMYAIQVGTASDVSFLIDFLPAYLFPSGEREVHEWLLSGISLGGHSTWISLKDEPRVKVGIPIIGCPDYLSLMKPRAEASGLPVASPQFPPALLEYIKAHDPSSVQASSREPSLNPFLGKHVLVLSGREDKIVPWFASEKFVDALQVGIGTKRVVVEEGAGHECTKNMVQELASFVWEHGVKSPQIVKATY